MVDVLLDAVLDCLKQYPILFAVYLLLEILEHRAGGTLSRLAQRSRKHGPLLGALVGCIPQCGFSAAMASLYSKRYITVGALIAVFLATSDEAIPILLSGSGNGWLILQLIAVKLVVGVAFGYLVDGLTRKSPFWNQGPAEPLPESGEHVCGHDCDCGHLHGCAHARHVRATRSQVANILLAALIHSAYILLYLFVATLALNLTIYWIGAETLGRLLITGSFFQPLLAALIGLIPNCAASVLLVELYMGGSISFASAVAGLCAGAGTGLLILFRTNRRLKENLAITGAIYAIGAAVGLLLNLVPFFR